MKNRNKNTAPASDNRYGRPQNIRVVLSSYLTELRESRHQKRSA
jgi:hypothetical protein